MAWDTPRGRRKALKQLGTGVVGAGALAASADVAAADHIIYDFPYEDEQQRTQYLTTYSGQNLKRTISRTVYIDQRETDTGDHRFWVEIGTAAGAAFYERNERAYDLTDHQITIEYPEDQATDYYFREDDDWVGAWDITHESNEDLQWVTDTAENVAGLAIGAVDSTIGTAFDVAMTVFEFLQGYSEYTDDTDTYRERWDYADTGDRFPYYAAEVSGFRRFEIRLDSGEITEFTPYCSCGSHYDLGFGAPDKTYTIQAPSY